jgi:hypothetical protein
MEAHTTPQAITDSWSTIKATADSGVVQNHYTVGDTKTITVNGVEQICTVVGINHDAANTITFACSYKSGASAYYTQQMNASDTNAGGWTSSAMRTYLSGTVLPLFEASTAIGPNVIQPVDKKSDGGYSDKTIKTTQDKLWLFSCDEIGWSSATNVQYQMLPTAYFVSNEGTLYEYFKEGCTTEAMTQRTNIGGSSWWWLRTSNTNDGSGFCFVYGNNVSLAGSVAGTAADSMLHIMVGFTI